MFRASAETLSDSFSVFTWHLDLCPPERQIHPEHSRLLQVSKGHYCSRIINKSEFAFSLSAWSKCTVASCPISVYLKCGTFLIKGWSTENVALLMCALHSIGQSLQTLILWLLVIQTLFCTIITFYFIQASVSHYNNHIYPFFLFQIFRLMCLVTLAKRRQKASYLGLSHYCS